MTFLRVFKRRGEEKSVQFSMAAVVTAKPPPVLLIEPCTIFKSFISLFGSLLIYLIAF